MQLFILFVDAISMGLLGTWDTNTKWEVMKQEKKRGVLEWGGLWLQVHVRGNMKVNVGSLCFLPVLPLFGVLYVVHVCIMFVVFKQLVLLMCISPVCVCLFFFFLKCFSFLFSLISIVVKIIWRREKKSPWNMRFKGKLFVQPFFFSVSKLLLLIWALMMKMKKFSSNVSRPKGRRWHLWS